MKANPANTIFFSISFAFRGPKLTVSFRLGKPASSIQPAPKLPPLPAGETQIQTFGAFYPAPIFRHSFRSEAAAEAAGTARCPTAQDPVREGCRNGKTNRL